MDSSRTSAPRASAARRTMLAVLLATALAGCASTTALPADAPLATYEWQAGEGMDALLEGELALEGGCVYVVNDDIGRVLPVFPRGLVAWDEGSETLTYGGTEFEMGDMIAAGGGWAPPPDSSSVPEQCEPDEWGEVMLVQDESLETMSARGY